MVLNASNVRVAVTGGWYYSPEESDHIPDVVRNGDEVSLSEIPAEFRSLGYFSSEGFSKSVEWTSTPLEAWQNSDTVRTLKTGITQTVTLNPIETTRNVLELVRNAEMDDDGKITADYTNDVRRSFIGNITDGNRTWRLWLPSATVTSVENEEYANGSEVAYSHEITAYPAVINGESYGPIVEFYPYLANGGDNGDNGGED